MNEVELYSLFKQLQIKAIFQTYHFDDDKICSLQKSVRSGKKEKAPLWLQHAYSETLCKMPALLSETDSFH